MQPNEQPKQASPGFLSGGGEMGMLIRSFNWSQTPLGPVDAWPQSLRTTLSIILNSTTPMFLFWGEDLICFYNDAYRPSLEGIGKHPYALGKRGNDVWPQTWDLIRPMITRVLSEGETSLNANQVLPIYRNEKFEEACWIYSYSSVIDESGKPAGVFVSCTETTETLRNASEERFRSITENSPVMIWETDANGLCTYLNKQWLNFTGQTIDEALGLGWLSALHPDDMEEAARIFEEANHNQQPCRLEYRLRNSDGSYQWMLDDAVPLHDDNGRYLGFSGSVININKRKLAEEKVRESEERFRALSDQAPMWVWMADENANVTYANKELLRFVGLPHYTELTDKAWENFVHPADLPRKYKVFATAAKRQKPYTSELRVKNADTGKYEWFLLNGVPRFVQNKFAGFIGTAVNINQQKKQLSALAVSEQRFRTLAESLPHLVWMTDEKGRQVFASSRWEEYTGIRPKGREDWEHMVHPADLENVGKKWTHSLQTGDAYHAELRLKSKTGEYRWFSLQGEPVRNEKGSIANWIGALVDIHNQKTLSQSLEEQVNKRTKELQRSNEDLQQFAHIASHDLKEPIRKIKTFITRLKEEIGVQLNDQGRMYIDRSLNAANRMIVMIDGVLTYSTISALDEMYEPVNLNEVIRNVQVDLELVIQQKGATIRYSNLPTLEGAPILMQQLFYNLVNNALKFTRPGVPPVITISSEIEQSDDHELARITVQDNGIGFEQEYADKIFDTFSRLHSKDKYEGSGLGLALCKNIVDRHGGTITAKGQPDHGATFIITLPVKR